MNKIAIGLVLGLVLGFFAGKIYVDRTIVLPKVTRIQAKSAYKYINPLLAYDIEDSGSFTESKILENKLNDAISQDKKDGKISEASVYYRGPSGSWVGINENDLYDPASLLKVPIMIAYFKQAESDPTVLTRKIKFDNLQDQSAPQAIPPGKQIQFGQEYTVEQLIDYMIINSDNSAANLLADRIFVDQQNAYTEMLTDLGLPLTPDKISPKNYSLFLRILRNATYLNREMSEKALGILAQTDFKDGLAAGVPSDIQIAHKFGEYGMQENGVLTGEELHDCGIIYAAKPYMLCVMTKGPKVEDLEKTIKTISSLVYTEAEK